MLDLKYTSPRYTPGGELFVRFVCRYPSEVEVLDYMAASAKRAEETPKPTPADEAAGKTPAFEKKVISGWWGEAISRVLPLVVSVEAEGWQAPGLAEFKKEAGGDAAPHWIRQALFDVAGRLFRSPSSDGDGGGQ